MMKDSAGPLVLVLLGLLSASVLAADKPLTHDGIAVGKNSKTHTSLPWTCTQTPLNTDPSSSVDSLRPSDVAALTAVGLPPTPGSQMAKVVDRLHEVLSIFNPAVVNMLPDQTNPDPTKHRTLVEQAEGLISTLNTQQMIDPEKDWKLLLLFVHFDEQCVCTEQVKAVLQEVESALQVLHSQLKRTMVNVVLWDAEPVTEHAQQSRSCACSGTLSEGERQLTRAVFALALQESITRHLLDKAWYSDRDDFTVQIQGRPIITKQSPTTDEAASQTDKLLLQLWANLLQPTGDQQNTNNKLQCPSEERPFFKTEKNSPSDVASRYDESASLSSTVWSGTSFPCTVLSPSSSIPTSVHAVRPADVKVVAAIGDSLTAGNGIGSAQNDLLDVLTQYRGLSWSIGGDSSLSTVTTLPNILKKFNPYVKGFSTGTGKPDTSQAFLNQAVAGAKAEDLVTQARALINRMKGDSRINFQSDWKVITVFIGGNDLCDSCHNTAHYSSTNFVNRVKAALDIFHKEVPRAIVNLVEPLYILPLRQLHKDTSLNCPTWVVDMICSCVIGPADGSTAYQQLINLNRAYQQGLVNLVKSGRYNTNSGFTVVLQPAFRNIVVPVVNGHPDRSYFAPDCFHTSKKGQTLMARALWNNMVEREGYKNTKLDFAQSYNLKCTTSSAPYIRTIQNSKSAYNAIDMEPMMISNGNSSSSVTSPETPPILKCPDPMPLWVPVGLGISGLLIGMFVSWLLFSWRQRQLEKRRALENIIEMKGTGL